MIKLLLLIFLGILFVRLISIMFMLLIVSRKLNKRIEAIADSLPDERSIIDLQIEINKIDWYIDSDKIMTDFVYLFKKIDSEQWLNPALFHLLYEHYKTK